MPQPAEIDQLLEQLLRLFAQTQQSIAEQLAALPASGVRRRARLRELSRNIDAELAALNANTASWLEGNFPAIYTMGAQQGAASIGTEFAWSQIHIDALQHLATDTYESVLAATRHVGDDVKVWIREQARRQTALSILEGRTAQQAARELTKAAAGDLVDELGGPVGVLRYADGSYRTLDDYADMLMRTKTAECFNEGTFNQLDEFDIGFVEVFDGVNCGWSTHNDGDSANGSIRTLKDARSHPLSHPRCRRSFGGRPDITSAKDARVAKPTPTAGQRADQAKAEKDRADQIARRAASRRQPRQPRSSSAGRKPRTPRSKTTGGRPQGTAAPSKMLDFDTPAARRFQPLAEQVDQLHGLKPGGRQTVVVTGKASNKGGHFSTGRKSRKLRASDNRMEIRVNDRGDGTEALSFLHEVGHRTDYDSTLSAYAPWTTANRSADPAVARAVLEFHEATRATNTIARVPSGWPLSYRQYFRSPEEIWARAYSQWAANRIGGDARRALEAAQLRNPGFQWPDDEFATIAPLVENILRARGLML